MANRDLTFALTADTAGIGNITRVFITDDLTDANLYLRWDCYVLLGCFKSIDALGSEHPQLLIGCAINNETSLWTEGERIMPGVPGSTLIPYEEVPVRFKHLR